MDEIKETISPNDESLADRIEKVIEILEFNYSEFSRLTGVSTSALHGILKLGKTPNADTLNMIASKVRDKGINIDWLITGKGDPVWIKPSDFHLILKYLETDLIVTLVSKDLIPSEIGDKELKRRGINDLMSRFIRAKLADEKDVLVQKTEMPQDQQIVSTSETLEPVPEPGPGFEKRREIGQLLVQLDVENLWSVRQMIDALIAAKQK